MGLKDRLSRIEGRVGPFPPQEPQWDLSVLNDDELHALHRLSVRVTVEGPEILTPEEVELLNDFAARCLPGGGT